jgi:RNA polymerase sigma-70 factor (ECF subfamily)
MSLFRELYQKHAGDVYRFAYWLCGNQFEAEDITSETFVRAWGNLDPSRMETVRAYLFRIARNIYLQGRRRDDRITQLPENRASPAGNPASLIADRLQLAQIFAHLQTLPESDRSAFILRVVYELPYAEIARVLRISLSSAKVKVYRVRLKLAMFNDNVQETD